MSSLRYDDNWDLILDFIVPWTFATSDYFNSVHDMQNILNTHLNPRSVRVSLHIHDIRYSPTREGLAWIIMVYTYKHRPSSYILDR